MHDAGAQQHGVLGHDHAQRAGLRRGLGRRRAGPPSAASAVSANAPAVSGRASRSLASACWIAASSAGRQVRTRLEQRRRRVAQVGEHLLQVVLAHERRRPGERLEQQAGERVDVGPPVDGVAARLLGRHVVRGAHGEARAGQPLLGPAVLRQPEVREERVLAAAAEGDQHVRRLHVAVHEPVRVGGVERAGHLRDDGHRPLGRERRALGQERPEVGALDVAHGHVEHAVDVAGVEHLDGVGMVDRRGGAALRFEAGAEHRVERRVRRDQLQRDGPLQREVGGAEDHAHPAPARDRLDPMPGEDGPHCRLARHPPCIRAGRGAECKAPGRGVTPTRPVVSPNGGSGASPVARASARL